MKISNREWTFLAAGLGLGYLIVPKIIQVFHQAGDPLGAPILPGVGVLPGGPGTVYPTLELCGLGKCTPQGFKGGILGPKCIGDTVAGYGSSTGGCKIAFAF